MIVTCLLSNQGPSPRNHQISITSELQVLKRGRIVTFGWGEGWTEKGEGRVETLSINANMMKAENCIILLNTTAYVVSRVDTVNCNEVGGYTVPINIWMGYSYQTTK